MILRPVFINYGTVHCIPKFNRLRLGAAFDRDLLSLDLHLLPLASIQILIGIFRIELFDVQVLLIDADDRESEGDIAVMTKRDSGERGLACADEIPSWRNQVNRFAKRRN